MKKSALVCVICLAACTPQTPQGIYVAHWRTEYVIADDPLLTGNGVVNKRTGFNQIPKWQVQQREHTSRFWRLDEPGSQALRFESGGLLPGDNYYQQIR